MDFGRLLGVLVGRPYQGKSEDTIAGQNNNQRPLVNLFVHVFALKSMSDEIILVTPLDCVLYARHAGNTISISDDVERCAEDENRRLLLG